MAGPQGAPRCQHRSGSATASPINDSTSSISTSSGRPGPGRSSASPGPGQPARPKRPRVIRRRTDGEVRAAISSTRSVSQFQLESSVALHRDCGCVSAWDHGNSPFQFDSSLAIHRDPERIGHPSPQAFQFDSSLAIHRDRCPDHVPEWVRVSIRFEFGDPSRRSGQWTCNACRVSIRFEFGDPSRPAPVPLVRSSPRFNSIRVWRSIETADNSWQNFVVAGFQFDSSLAIHRDSHLTFLISA